MTESRSDYEFATSFGPKTLIHLFDGRPQRQEDWEDSPPGWPQYPTYG
jgi:hypothetical protein